MDNKRGYISSVTLFLVVTLVALSKASLSTDPKFGFPKHLIGVNYSDTTELKPYLIYNPVDLGVDIYDDEAPLHIRHALANSTLSDDVTLNQYSDAIGIPRIRNAVARMYSSLIGHELNPDENVIITIGATEAVYLAFHGHTSPGDEWVVIEPAYTMYVPMIKLAGGTPRFTTLKLKKTGDTISSDDWLLDRQEMESLFTNKTKGILLNNPLNPLGKMYRYQELQFIASMAKKYNTIVISDEAHEWIGFNKPHVRIASLPGMYERTITIGSSSKSFSVAGWRIGWALGPSSILNHLKTVHERAVDSPPTPQQNAIAYGFEEEIKNFGKPNSFFVTHAREVQAKRDLIVQGFKDAGMVPIVPDGGYCMIAKWTSLKNDTVEVSRGSAMNFVKWLIKNVQILGLPMPGFYSESHKILGEKYVRYCFNKKQETLLNAVKNLGKLKTVQF